VASDLGSKFEHNNRSGFEIQPNVRLLWTPTLHQTFWRRLPELSELLRVWIKT